MQSNNKKNIYASIYMFFFQFKLPNFLGFGFNLLEQIYNINKQKTNKNLRILFF